MQNRVYVIGIYVCGMVRMPLKRARGERFSPKKHGFLGLTPVYRIKQALLYTQAPKCEKIPAKMLAFQETKS